MFCFHTLISLFLLNSSLILSINEPKNPFGCEAFPRFCKIDIAKLISNKDYVSILLRETMDHDKWKLSVEVKFAEIDLNSDWMLMFVELNNFDRSAMLNEHYWSLKLSMKVSENETKILFEECISISIYN